MTIPATKPSIDLTFNLTPGGASSITAAYQRANDFAATLNSRPTYTPGDMVKAAFYDKLDSLTSERERNLALSAAIVEKLLYATWLRWHKDAGELSNMSEPVQAIIKQETKRLAQALQFLGLEHLMTDGMDPELLPKYQAIVA